MSTSRQSTSASARRIQFAFTDEQEQFRSAVRRFLNDKSPTTEVRRLMATAEGYDPAVWRQMSEDLALPGIHIPDNMVALSPWPIRPRHGLSGPECQRLF